MLSAAIGGLYISYSKRHSKQQQERCQDPRINMQECSFSKVTLYPPLLLIIMPRGI